MHGSYNWYLVALSLVVAMLASYTTLDLTARIRSIEAEGRRRFYWLLGHPLDTTVAGRKASRLLIIGVSGFHVASYRVTIYQE